MNYELRSGERGAFTVGGPFAAPLKIAIGLLLGAGMVAFCWYTMQDEVEYLDPSNEHHNFAVFVAFVIALLPAILIWSGVRKECIRLSIRVAEKRVDIFWRGVFSNWLETLSVDQVEYFDVRPEGGRFPRWHLALRRQGGERKSLDVGKFDSSELADRECEEANSFLRRAKRL